MNDEREPEPLFVRACVMISNKQQKLYKENREQGNKKKKRAFLFVCAGVVLLSIRFDDAILLWRDNGKNIREIEAVRLQQVAWPGEEKVRKNRFLVKSG